jgi:hypothetical protein
MQTDITVCVHDPRIALFFRVQYGVNSIGDIPPEISRDSIILIDAKSEPPVLISDGNIIVNPLFLERARLYDVSL